MRKKREELRENVILAARTQRLRRAMYEVNAVSEDRMLNALADLDRAVEELDNYEAATITGVGARWAEGSDTSALAAELATTVQGSLRHEVIGQLAQVAEFSKPGYTDEQLERRLGAKHQTLSSARNWLVENGWVRDSGVRRRNSSSKRQAAVWELTPAAWTKLKGGA